MDSTVFNKILSNVSSTVSLWKPSGGSLECTYISRNLGSLKLPQCIGLSFEQIFNCEKCMPSKMQSLKSAFEEVLAANKTVEIDTFEDFNNVITRVFRIDTEFVSSKTICCSVIDKEGIRSRDESECKDRRESESIRFIKSIGQEIRTPLNNIVAMTDLFIDTPLTTEQFEYIDTIRHCNYNLMSIVNDILDYTQLVSHKIVLQSEPFLLQQCIQNSIDISSSRLHEQDVDITFSVDPNVPSQIKSDEYRLSQIIITIITNTIKQKNRDGKIHLSVKGVAPSASPINSVGTIKLEFNITDTGFGIDKQLMTKIKNAQPKRCPLGLGFTIIEYLVELFHGHFWVECNGTTGSTFNFTIMTSEAPRSIINVSSNSEIQFPNKTVLLIDEDATDRFEISTLLLKWKLQPIIASSIKEALIYLQSTTVFDAIFVDIANSVYCADTIRTLRLDKIPIVAMFQSNRTDQTDKKEQIRYYLQKPVKENRLLNICQQIFINSTEPIERKDTSTNSINNEARILLVDSLSSQEKVLKSALRRLGYKNIDVAYDGGEALRMIESAKEPYEIILLGDLKIPKKSGCDLSYDIRKWCYSTKTELPVILACATNVTRVEKSRQCKYIDGFIPKPIFSENLDIIIQTSVEKHVRKSLQRKSNRRRSRQSVHANKSPNKSPNRRQSIKY